MKISLVSTFKQSCGIASYTEDLATALQEAGHDITVYAERIHPNEKEKSSKISFVRIWDRSSFTARGFLGTLAGKAKPDVIHFQHEFGLFPNNKEFILTIETLAKQGVKVIVTLHTITAPPQRLDFFQNLPSHTNIIYAAHTEASQAILSEWDVFNTVYIPHGVTQHEQAAYLRVAAKKQLNCMDMILCPGFVSPSKGHIEILEGFASLVFQKFNWKLFIVGEARDAGYQQLLYETVDKYGLSNHVVFYNGFQESMDKYFMAANVVVLGAGKTTPFSASGQLHTALGYNVPVVAKNVPIYAGNTGVYYYSTPAELALFVKHAASTSTSDEFKLLATARNWTNIVQKHLQIYSTPKI